MQHVHTHVFGDNTWNYILVESIFADDIRINSSLDAQLRILYGGKVASCMEGRYRCGCSSTTQ